MDYSYGRKAPSSAPWTGSCKSFPSLLAAPFSPPIPHRLDPYIERSRLSPNDTLTAEDIDDLCHDLEVGSMGGEQGLGEVSGE